MARFRVSVLIPKPNLIDVYTIDAAATATCTWMDEVSSSNILRSPPLYVGSNGPVLKIFVVYKSSRTALMAMK